MTELELLERALALIQAEETWNAGTYARLADGTVCSVIEPEAKMFDAGGALRRAAHIFNGRRFQQAALARLTRHCGSSSISQRNDNGGHEAAVQMYRDAIEEARGATG